MHFLIIGAGFSGVVAAHQLSQAGHRCTIVDRRDHIAGNAHDSASAVGVLTHNYGPHYFRSNSQKVVNYLSQFTSWHRVDYKIKSFAQEQLWPFPINLNTFEQLIGKASSTAEFEAYLAENRHPIKKPKNSEEVILSQVGTELYELFFEGYTLKQWERHPRELDPSVCGRVPIRTNRDNRYLTEEFQALPAKGFSALFDQLLGACQNTTLLLNTESAEARSSIRHDHLIFTGPIDEYFNYQYGPLPYRSLRFEKESFTADQLIPRQPIAGQPGFYQAAMQINYPSVKIPHTRIVEIKHASGQKIDATTIVREYPDDWARGKDPYYPVPTDESKILYQRYAKLAAAEQGTTFIGRLATYRYYNMDQVTAMALSTSERLIKRFS